MPFGKYFNGRKRKLKVEPDDKTLILVVRFFEKGLIKRGMQIPVQLKDGTHLQLEHKAFASGGEGELYKILNPIHFQNQVVKIYKPEKITKERENKTEFLAANPPKIEVRDGHHSVIWINQLIYNKGKFCGFIMPIAKGEKLELLCHPKLPKILSSEWDKFDSVILNL